MNNLVLSSMAKIGREAMMLHLHLVDLPKRHNLEMVRRQIDHVYFMETGVAAVISATDNSRIAVALIGYEGASGIGVFLGDDRSPHACEMLTDGTAYRTSRADMKRLMQEHEPIRTHVTRYALAFYNQAAHTALSNASSSVPRRVARWILMMQDRLSGDNIPLTHELIADMLDIRRPGITTALKDLEDRSLISTARGLILVRDRHGLEALASDFYGLPEIEYQRLMGVAEGTPGVSSVSR